MKFFVTVKNLDIPGAGEVTCRRGDPKEFSRAKNLTFPVWWAVEESNLPPLLYQRSVLPLN